MSELSELSTRVRLGWASEWEQQRVKDLTAEEDRNWQQYHQACRVADARRDAQTIPSESSKWLKAMGIGDYIKDHRVVSERESFEEYKDRIQSLKNHSNGKI